MNRHVLSKISVGAIGALALCLTATGALAAHPDVTLRDEGGTTLALGSTEPYSPKQTCGLCHDYETITMGYHFQQGFDELVLDSERTTGQKPFIKSPGMYGKW